MCLCNVGLRMALPVAKIAYEPLSVIAQIYSNGKKIMEIVFF